MWGRRRGASAGKIRGLGGGQDGRREGLAEEDQRKKINSILRATRGEYALGTLAARALRMRVKLISSI